MTMFRSTFLDQPCLPAALAEQSRVSAASFVEQESDVPPGKSPTACGTVVPIHVENG